MDEPVGLTELQIAVMEVLWSRGAATVAEVRDALSAERALALTTVATLLRRLEKRGAVRHRAEGRQYLYEACVSRPEVQRSMLGGLVDRLFGGDPAALVSHLIGSGQVDADDLSRVRELVERRQRELEGDDGR